MELLNKIEIAKFCDENISSYNIKNFMLEHFSLKPSQNKTISGEYENNSQDKTLENDNIEIFSTIDYHENEFLEDDDEWNVVESESTYLSSVQNHEKQFFDDQFNYNNFFNQESPEVYEKSIKGVLIESWDRGGIVVLPFFLTENLNILPHPDFFHEWNMFRFKKEMNSFKYFENRTLLLFSNELLLKVKSNDFSYNENDLSYYYHYVKKIDLFNSLNDKLELKSSIKKHKI